MSTATLTRLNTTINYTIVGGDLAAGDPIVFLKSASSPDWSAVASAIDKSSHYVITVEMQPKLDYWRGWEADPVPRVAGVVAALVDVLKLGTIFLVAEDWKEVSVAWDGDMRAVGIELETHYPRYISKLLNKEPLSEYWSVLTDRPESDHFPALAAAIEAILRQTVVAAPPLMKTHGSYEVPICTSKPNAGMPMHPVDVQDYFNAGMRLTLGFDYVRALPYFRYAAHLDPKCAMCLWGHAFCLGKKINAPAQPPLMLRAHALAQKALKLIETPFSPMQRAECERDRLLVSALAKRYPADPTAEAIKAADVAYGEAMLAVAQQFPHDVTALVVAADAFMVQAPWNWWNLTTAVTGEGKKAGEGATALVDNLAPAKPLLAAVLAIDPNHPAALHLSVHLYEQAEQSMRLDLGGSAAETLDAVAFSTTDDGYDMSDLPHLLHMPSHVLMHTGKYSMCVKENVAAWSAPLASNLFPMHNAESGLWCARMAGRKKEALKLAEELEARARKWKLSRHTEPEGSNGCERWIVLRLLTLLYFEEYDVIVAEEDGSKYAVDELPYVRMVFLMAKGTAAAVQGRVAEAETYLTEIMSSKVAKAVQATYSAGELGYYSYAVAAYGLYPAWLNATILHAKGNVKAAAAKFVAAAAVEEAIYYDEPVTFFTSLRHEAGSMFLAAGDWASARKQFELSLVRYPASGVTLFGLALACQFLEDTECQNDNEAKAKAAWADADPEVSLFQLRNMRKALTLDQREHKTTGAGQKAQGGMARVEGSPRGTGAAAGLLVAAVAAVLAVVARRRPTSKTSTPPQL